MKDGHNKVLVVKSGFEIWSAWAVLSSFQVESHL
jgi:hypothetical protein